MNAPKQKTERPRGRVAAKLGQIRNRRAVCAEVFTHANVVGPVVIHFAFHLHNITRLTYNNEVYDECNVT